MNRDTSNMQLEARQHACGASKSSYATIRNEESTTEGVPGLNDTNSMFTKFAFPFKLHSILENSERADQDHIISWLPSGKAFKIHKPKEFAAVIMPQYFNQTKYRSFQRQLYIYGFDRVKDKSSNDYGAYFHDLFIRGESDLCLDMQRKKIKGTGLSNEERRRRSQSKFTPSCKNGVAIQTLTPLQSILSTFADSHQNQFDLGKRNGQKSLKNLSSESNFHQNFLSTTGIEQMPRKVSLTETSAVSVIKSAMQVQEMAFRRGLLNRPPLNDIHVITDTDPKLEMLVKPAARRCSLGFVRESQMGRRGSLLFDGDVVGFGDRHFHFTTEY